MNSGDMKRTTWLAAPLLVAAALLVGAPATAGKKGKTKAAKAEVKTAQPDGASKTHGEGEAAEGVVNVNTATSSELSLLPGIGPKKAQGIIDLRKKAPLKSPKDLLKVKGIGKKSIKKLLPYVTVSGPTTLKTKVSGG